MKTIGRWFGGNERGTLAGGSLCLVRIDKRDRARLPEPRQDQGMEKSWRKGRDQDEGSMGALINCRPDKKKMSAMVRQDLASTTERSRRTTVQNELTARGEFKGRPLDVYRS